MLAHKDLAERIDALLPQTQCTRCGYPSCSEYAHAVAHGQARLNRCPPGGEFTISRLADLLEEVSIALDPECGEHTLRHVVFIDEAWCIGCTLCIKACPVDAIVGAAKRMHTVIETLCTGCDLCIAPCPVDCIHVEPARSGPVDPKLWLQQRASLARQRFLDRTQRLTSSAPDESPDAAEPDERKRLIAQAVARSKARRGGVRV